MQYIIYFTILCTYIYIYTSRERVCVCVHVYFGARVCVRKRHSYVTAAHALNRILDRRETLETEGTAHTFVESNIISYQRTQNLLKHNIHELYKLRNHERIIINNSNSNLGSFLRQCEIRYIRHRKHSEITHFISLVLFFALVIRIRLIHFMNIFFLKRIFACFLNLIPFH